MSRREDKAAELIVRIRFITSEAQRKYLRSWNTVVSES